MHVMKRILAALFTLSLVLMGCSSPAPEAAKSDTAETQPAEVKEPEAKEPEAKSSRENPFPLGAEIKTDDWTIVVNSVDMDATKAVVEENLFNDPPADGNVFIMPNVTITYTGNEADGAMPMAVFAYVTVDGNTINSYDTFAVAPDALDTLTTLYEGASVSGNLVLEVPANSAADGVLVITPDLFAKKQYVAVR